MNVRTLENRAFDFRVRVVSIDDVDWYVLDDFLRSIKASLKTGPATSMLKFQSDMRVLSKKEWEISTSSCLSSFVVVTIEGINDIISGMPASEMAMAFGKWLNNLNDEKLKPEVISSLSHLLSYKGNNIEINDKGMWNATQMAKPFGKRMNDWLSNKQTLELVGAISTETRIPASALIQVVKGGNNTSLQGTWIHEKLVIDFAQWLNVKFRVWCNTQIETLMREGRIELTKPESLLDWMKLAVANEEKRLALEKENKKMRPVVEYHDTVLKSNGTYTVTQIAKELGLSSAEKLNGILRDKHIQYKSGKQWVLYADYCGMEYTDTATSTFEKNNMTFSNAQTVWTEKGCKFIHELLSHCAQ